MVSRICGFLGQNLKNGDNGAMVTNLLKGVMSNTGADFLSY